MADLLGIELARGSRTNESRKVGEQIDELLRGEKARDAQIRKGIRSRKAKARSKPGAEAKLTELDAEQHRRRAEHWDAEVTLNLPDPITTKVETERERPPPPPKPPPRLPTVADLAKLDAAVVRADADVVAARRRYKRAEVTMQKCLTEWTEAASIDDHEWDDEGRAALRDVRANLEAEYEAHRALVGELRRGLADAEHRHREARDAAQEARDDGAAEKQAAARAAEFQARMAARAERFRLEKHGKLMAFYDSMTPEELREYLQARGRARQAQRDKDSPPPPLAPGPPRRYDMRGPLPPPPPPEQLPDGSWKGSRVPAVSGVVV